MNIQRLLRAGSLLVLLFVSSLLHAQNRTITGRITGANGAGVSGASIVVKGSSTGTTSGENGAYTLTVPADATTLVVSSVGFGSQEVPISDRTTIDVGLQTATGNLNEVVVVAYGTRRKSDLTGSVTSVNAKDFQKGFIPSSEQLLQGKVAGLQITSGGGSAGGGSRIRIRGGASLNASNDPLIVIDGVPVEGGMPVSGSANVLNTINPNDIESMSVLKDASATALYGSRASNGVIIITTKKGARGKLRFNFNTQGSVGIVAKKVDVLSADQLRAVVNADAAATGNNTYKNVLGTASTDWQDQIYQKAFGWDNTFSASGSLGKYLPFRASVGYLTQQGILQTNKFNRVSSSLNLSPRFFDDHLSVNLNAKASRTGNRFADEGAIGSAVSFDPTQPVTASNKYGGYFEWLQANSTPIDLSTRNPLALLKLRDNTSNVNRLIGNVQLDYKLHFFPDLHVLANLGMDYIKGKGNDNIDSLSATNYKTGGRRVYYQQGKKNTLADIQLLYAKELRNIRFDVLVGHSYQEFLTNVYNYSAFSYRTVADPNNPQLKDTIANSQPTFATDNPKYRLESYLGRINATIADKYLLTASLRRDASSKFSPQNRVGYFPAVALAWRLKNEFFKNTAALTDLKLRGSWGITGQQEGISYYGYIPRYSRSSASASYQFGDQFYTYLRPEGYDPDIKWETTATTNVGLDFAFFQNRISGSADYYFKKTRDLLATIQLSPGTNFVNEITTNVGNVENRGVEFTLNTTPVRRENLTWDLSFNYAYNTSKITNLLKQEDPNFKGAEVSGISGGTGNLIGINAVGAAPYTFNVFKQIYDKTGRPIEGLYEDINRDGIINNDDRYFYKKPAADVLLGISTQVLFNKLSLGVAAHAQLGNYMYNNFNSNSGVLRAIKNPLTFTGNAGSNYLETNFTNNQYFSDYYIENASFLRLDNINVGYNVGKVFRNQAALRVQASVQNVFVITKYSGLDPENANDSGVDNMIYPRPRVFALGLNFDF